MDNNIKNWKKYISENVEEGSGETTAVDEAGQSWSEVRPDDVTSWVNTISQFLAVKGAPDEVRDALSKINMELKRSSGKLEEGIINSDKLVRKFNKFLKNK